MWWWKGKSGGVNNKYNVSILSGENKSSYLYNFGMSAAHRIKQTIVK